MPRFAHAVFFTLKDPRPEHADQLVQGCQEHLSGHDGAVFFSVGRRDESMQREVNDQAFHVALHLVFESREAHDRYQPHERHQRFIEQCQHLWSEVRIFDADLADG